MCKIYVKVAKLRQIIERSKVFRSLRLRLFFLILVSGIIPCAILHFGILDMYLDNTIDIRTTAVETQVKIVADHLLTYNYMLDNSNEIVNAELAQLSNLYDGRVLVIDGNFRIIKDTYGISEGKTIISEDIIKCFKDGTASNRVEQNGYIEIVVPIEERIINTDIRLFISGPGGSVTAAMNLISYIRHTSLSVTGVAVNNCSSASALIWLACENREIFPYSRIMLHEITHVNREDVRYKVDRLEEIVADLKGYNDRVYELIADAFGKSKKEIEDLLSGKDYYFYADELEKMGIATIVDTL